MRERDRERRRFEYRRSDPDDVRKQMGGGGSFDSPIRADVKLFKPREGTNRIRILPRTWKDDEGPRHWAYKVFLHYNVGADKSSYLCPRKTIGEKEPCPICDERVSASRQGAGDDELRELRPQARQYCWVIDRKDEEAGPLLFGMPPTKVHDQICELARGEGGELLDVDHPDEGYDISFRREGTQKTTQYSAILVDRRPSPLCDDEALADKWLRYVEDNPVPTLLVHKTGEELARIFAGQPQRGADDDEAPPVRTRREQVGDADDRAEDDAPTRRDRVPYDDEDPPPRRHGHRADDPEPDEAPKRARRAEPEEDRPKRASMAVDDEVDDRRQAEDPEPRSSRTRRRVDDLDDLDRLPDEPRGKFVAPSRGLRDRVDDRLRGRSRE